MSDTNAELVRLGNQVAMLEEEKGNLQLSLVDFDEVKGRNHDGPLFNRLYPSSVFYDTTLCQKLIIFLLT